MAKKLDKVFNIGNYKGQGVTTPLPQRGKSNVPIDMSRPALEPGKRVSRTGKTYWETRKNRSDARGKKV